MGEENKDRVFLSFKHSESADFKEYSCTMIYCGPNGSEYTPKSWRWSAIGRKEFSALEELAKLSVLLAPTASLPTRTCVNQNFLDLIQRNRCKLDGDETIEGVEFVHGVKSNTELFSMTFFGAQKRDRPGE